MSAKEYSKNIVNDAIIKEINDAVGSMDHGDVVIKVRKARIFQIEVTARQCFDGVWKIEEGGEI